MKRFGLSGTALKILACVCMLIDHVGAYLLPQYRILRVIGRLAFPIFAFCIAEGCRYTQNKLKHFFLIFGLGAVWEALLIWYYREWDGNILLTFSLSVLVVYAWQWAKRQCSTPPWWRGIAAIALFGAVVIGIWMLTKAVHFEYGFFGIMLAPAAALFDYDEGKAPVWMKRLDRLPVKLAVFMIALLMLAWPTIGRTVQVYSLLSIVLLAFYNGKAGDRRLKYAFYVFYPLHLIVIECVRVMVKEI